MNEKSIDDQNANSIVRPFAEERQRHAKEELGWGSLADAIGIPDEQAARLLEQSEHRAYIQKMISLLPKPLTTMEQQILTNRYYEGLTMEQTANALGMTLNEFNAAEQKLLSTLRRTHMKIRK